MTTPSLSFAERLLLCWVAFFRVLFDGRAASRVQKALANAKQLPEPSVSQRRVAKKSDANRKRARLAPDSETPPDSEATASPRVAAKAAPRRAAEPPVSLAADGHDSALLLLRLLQGEGRLVDFLQQDIAGYEDAAVATAVRVVHEGCRKVLRRHVGLEAVRAELEGSVIEVPTGFDAQAIKLLGNVVGTGPFQGILRHHGWRAARVELPQAIGQHDSSLIAPAEVEVS